MSSVRASPVWGLRCQPVSPHAASPLTHSSVVVLCKKDICSFHQIAETSSWVFAVFPGVQHHFWGCSRHGIHQLSKFMLWAWSENHKVGNCYSLSIGSVGEEKWLVRLVSRSQPQVVAIEITYITLSRLLSLYITECVLSFTVNNIFSPPSRNWLTQRRVSISHSDAVPSTMVGLSRRSSGLPLPPVFYGPVTSRPLPWSGIALLNSQFR